MRSFLRIFIFLAFANFVFAAPIVDELTLLKIKKLVQKEEDIAKAYKEYLLKNGKVPTKDNKLSIQVLIDNGFLPKGFDITNPFGVPMSLENNNFIKKFDTNDKNLKIALNEYYFKSKNREFTSPLKDNIEIKLNNKEIFILNNKDKITTTKPSGTGTKDKFYLDDKGVLNYYRADGQLGYSFDKEIVLSKDVHIYDKTTNKYNNNWADGLNFKSDILKVGTSIFDSNRDNNSKEYIVVGPGEIVEINKEEKEYGKTIIQFNRRAGGMIVNGDIYTWGNNGNAITGIDAKKTLTGSTTKGLYPLVTVPIPLRAKIYEEINVSTTSTPSMKLKYYTEDYYSSPKRPKFIDFFAGVYTGTCGISTQGELYCNGTTGNQRSTTHTGGDYIDIDNTSAGDGKLKGELLYRSKYFDGSSGKKIKKVFANNQIWHFLGEDGKVYIYGSNTAGFGGLGTANDKALTNYQAIPNLTNIKDITYLLTFGFRRIGALSESGKVYIWGVEDNNGTNTKTIYNSCVKTWKNSANDSKTYDMCGVVEITTENSNLENMPNFNYLRGGIDAFIARDANKNYYKIKQEKNQKIEVNNLSSLIVNKWGYNANDDINLISADVSRTVSELSAMHKISSGIVWINSKNELKGDIFTSANQNDNYFIDSIKKIKWTQIKVIDENNGMCGIDTNNQMYCWGVQSYYRDVNGNNRYKVANTYLIPVFNTNLYDLKTDFMVAEAGDDYITPISSTEWQTTILSQDNKTHTDAFFMKYPTYIGGFNYEFEFK